MCNERSLAGIISEFSEQRIPSGGTLLQIMEDFSQLEESLEIVLCKDADASVCCQNFIDFWENHFIPYMVNWSASHNTTEIHERFLKETEKEMQPFINKLQATNCGPFFDHLRECKEAEDQTIVQRKIERRDIAAVYWWLSEFDKCLSGEEFDFSEYSAD
jgi:hypothetical protein|tara:strand:+ start:568 stop:1047 length:480 start_codon:yes stop_codon:yes gene_type:complete